MRDFDNKILHRFVRGTINPLLALDGSERRLLDLLPVPGKRIKVGFGTIVA